MDKKFIFEGTLLTKKQISLKVTRSYSDICDWLDLADCSDGDDVTDLVLALSGSHIVSDGDVYGYLGIDRTVLQISILTGFDEAQILERIWDSESTPGDPVDEIVNSLVPADKSHSIDIESETKRAVDANARERANVAGFIYKSEELTRTQIAEKSGLSYDLVCMKIRRGKVLKGQDVTELLDHGKKSNSTVGPIENDSDPVQIGAYARFSKNLFEVGKRALDLNVVKRLRKTSTSRNRRRQYQVEISKLSQEFMESLGDANTYRDYLRKLEATTLLFALRESDMNITDASKLLGLSSRSSVYSMFRRVGIDLEAVRRDDSGTKVVDDV